MNYFFLLLFSLFWCLIFADPVYAVAQTATKESPTGSTTVSTSQRTSTEETTTSGTYPPTSIQGNEPIYLSLIGIACALFLLLLLFIHSKRQ